MEKNSTYKSVGFPTLLKDYFDKGYISEKERNILEEFFLSYESALIEKNYPSDCLELFKVFLEQLKDLKLKPYPFQPFHVRVREPFDFYQFGNEFIRPLVDFKHSTFLGFSNFKEVSDLLKRGENAIFLANHQIEADPQAISLLLEKDYPKIAEEMIFVAGERVITDSLAVPFSMGRNLLCIYSKKYIDVKPSEKLNKQLHNKKTMLLMSKLLSEGGKCIYVAPSGGRDRPNANGVVEVAPFDSQSIEMFYLMAKQAKTPTHFYPLALKTFEILPPPATIQIELGEMRKTHGGSIHLSLGKKIDMESLAKKDLDKQLQRQMRATLIWNLVKSEYGKFS